MFCVLPHTVKVHPKSREKEQSVVHDPSLHSTNLVLQKQLKASCRGLGAHEGGFGQRTGQVKHG